MKKEKFCVLGDGAWGCALASVLSRNGHSVIVWGRQPEHMEEMNRTHENSRFLPGVTLPPGIVFTSDMEFACRGADCVILASPSQYMRGTLERFKPFFIPDQHLLVNISKGIENKTLLRMSELCSEVLGKNHYCVLSGPSHAEEVVRMIPTQVVAASTRVSLARRVCRCFMNESFRVYTSTDVTGVEIGGSLKNVYAIAAGISDGAGLGDNPKAAMMTRCIAELSRLGVKLGGRRQTFSGLSGIGDLIVTCTSRHSRNRHVGEELGRGRNLADIMASMNNMVAEGVKTCESAHDLALANHVEMPIADGVYEILNHGVKPVEVMHALMTRKARSEHEDD